MENVLLKQKHFEIRKEIKETSNCGLVSIRYNTNLRSILWVLLIDLPTTTVGSEIKASTCPEQRMMEPRTTRGITPPCHPRPPFLLKDCTAHENISCEWSRKVNFQFAQCRGYHYTPTWKLSLPFNTLSFHFGVPPRFELRLAKSGGDHLFII